MLGGLKLMSGWCLTTETLAGAGVLASSKAYKPAAGQLNLCGDLRGGASEASARLALPLNPSSLLCFAPSLRQF